MAGEVLPGGLDRDALSGFVIGVHRRSEQWTAHELRLLMDELPLPVEGRDDFVSYVEAALGLLAAYDRVLVAEAGSDDEDDFPAEGDQGWMI